MIEKFKVGLIVKPQGVRGELKIEPTTDDPARFKKLKKVYIDDKPYELTQVRIGSGVVFAYIFGVNDRNTAELFRNKYIVIDRENAVSLKKDSYFIADLIGAKLFFENGKELGVVTDLTSASTDYFTVKTISNKIVRFPHLKRVINNVDIDNGVITLNEKAFLEVCVYED